jgi:membrane-associated protease RseP (regulator of RpoE activity)
MNRSTVTLIVVAVFVSVCSGAFAGGIAGFFAGRLSAFGPRRFAPSGYRSGVPMPRPFFGQPNPNIRPNQGAPRQPNQPAPNQSNPNNRQPNQPNPNNPQPNPPQNNFPWQGPPAQRNAPPFQQPNTPRPPVGVAPTMQVVVAEVVKDSPAEKSGLRVNDVIVALDGQNITNQQQLMDMLRQHKAGDVVALRLYRGNETHTVSVTLDANPSGGAGAYLGVRLMLRPANAPA